VAESKNLEIAILMWRGESEGEKGFKDGLQELGYFVDYTELNAGKDKKELGRLIRKELQPNLSSFDYVYSFGTTVSKATKVALRGRVPHLFNIVAAPVETGIVQSLHNSGGNISGATNKISLEKQMKEVLKVFSFKCLGLIFNSREKNTMIERQRLQDVGEKFHFEVIDLRSPPVEGLLEKNLEKLINKTIEVDAIYLPLDSHILTNAKLIGAKLREAKIKSIGSIKGYVEHGALIGMVPDYYELGKGVASIVDRHQKGAQLQTIPVYRPTKFILMVNKTTANLLQVKVPETLLNKAIIFE
jgi:ABC-type uncharacterized transport system substrate-binding protein